MVTTKNITIKKVRPFSRFSSECEDPTNKGTFILCCLSTCSPMLCLSCVKLRYSCIISLTKDLVRNSFITVFINQYIYEAMVQTKITLIRKYVKGQVAIWRKTINTGTGEQAYFRQADEWLMLVRDYIMLPLEQRINNSIDKREETISCYNQ